MFTVTGTTGELVIVPDPATAVTLDLRARLALAAGVDDVGVGQERGLLPEVRKASAAAAAAAAVTIHPHHNKHDMPPPLAEWYNTVQIHAYARIISYR